MAIYKSEPYYYGADADGNRGVWMRDIEIISDVSGEELDQEDAYCVDGDVCDMYEAIDLLGYELYTRDGKVTCENCGEELDPEYDTIYVYKLGAVETYYCEECVLDYVREFKLKVE